MPIPVECAWCGLTFGVPPSWLKKRRYCSPACRRAKRASESQLCATCGVSFTVPPSRRKLGTRHCSMACYAADKVPIVERFWPKVDRSGDGCWEWRRGRKNGYGVLTVTDRYHRIELYAHRLAYELTHGSGSIPPGKSVLHHCDNRPCCRPNHLYVGTQQDNNADRDNRDRVRHGSTHANAKLTEVDVQRIRTLHATGQISQRKLATAFGVNHQSISDLLNGKTWKRT